MAQVRFFNGSGTPSGTLVKDAFYIDKNNGNMWLSTTTASSGLKQINKSSYMPLTGGTISGNTTIGGNITVNGTTTLNDSTTIRAGKSIQFDTLKLPTTNGGNTFGTGSNGQVLKSNGTTVYWGTDNNTNTDTKNTAGSTDTSSQIYLIGALSQDPNPQTYSDNQVYVTNGTLTLAKTTDASGTADNKPALIVGGTTSQQHLEIDGNEIQSKSNGTTAAALSINAEGGQVTIGTGGLVMGGHLTINNNLQLKTNKIAIPTVSGGTDYDNGTAGKTIVSNGTNVYWGEPIKLSTMPLTSSSASTSGYYNPYTWKVTGPYDGVTGIYAIIDTESSSMAGIFSVKCRVSANATNFYSGEVRWMHCNLTTPLILTLTTAPITNGLSFKLYISGFGTYRSYRIIKLAEHGEFTVETSSSIISAIPSTDFIRSTSTGCSINAKVISAPTTSNGATYGVGSDGYVLKSNGSSVFWSQSVRWGTSEPSGTANKGDIYIQYS